MIQGASELFLDSIYVRDSIINLTKRFSVGLNGKSWKVWRTTGFSIVS
jgi:hypothetical protein